MTNELRFPINGSFKVVQRDILVQVAGAIQAGDPARAFAIFTDPANLVEVFNNIGAQDYFYKLAYPDGPPVDPLASFRARQAVSQNCAWVLITPAESGALRAVYGDVVSQYNQFYTVGGSGGLGIAERVDATSPSGYAYIDANQQWQPDVGGAADARVAAIAASQNPPRPVPPPI